MDVQLHQEGKSFQGCCLPHGLSMALWVISAEVTYDLPHACGLGFAECWKEPRCPGDG